MRRTSIIMNTITNGAKVFYITKHLVRGIAVEGGDSLMLDIFHPV